MNTRDLPKRWRKFSAGCGGCAGRRAAIKKIARSFVRSRRRVAVMFSGGLDSTYVAWKLKNDGNKVDLYHVQWEYPGGRDNSGEFEAAVEIASRLDLPLYNLGRVSVPEDYNGNVMRVPTIGAMLICHRDLTFETLATGMAPAISDRDKRWHWLLRAMANSCMPDLTIIHPRDGILRSQIKLPAFFADHTYSHTEKDDSE